MTRTVDGVLHLIKTMPEKEYTHVPTCDLRMLRDEILRLRALTTWRPIETAPRDGMLIQAVVDGDVRTDLERVLRDQRLDREDLQIQLDAAAVSAAKGHYAVAKAELRGAMHILDAMEKRCGYDYG